MEKPTARWVKRRMKVQTVSARRIGVLPPAARYHAGMEQNWNLPEQPKRTRRRFWLKLAAGLLFAVVAYGGAYYATVQPGWMIISGVTWGPAWPEYRLPVKPSTETEDLARKFFAPIHWIDRKLRPEFWGDD